jgi:hypothetical protein
MSGKKVTEETKVFKVHPKTKQSHKFLPNTQSLKTRKKAFRIPT